MYVCVLFLSCVYKVTGIIYPTITWNTAREGDISGSAEVTALKYRNIPCFQIILSL